MNLDFNLYSGNYKRFLIIPAILFLVFALLIFVFPGLEQGLDLKGGTLLVIKSEKSVDKADIEKVLKDNFELSNLLVSTTAGATGYGTNIEFTENKVLSKADSLLKEAIESNSRDKANQALALVSDFAVPEKDYEENNLFFEEATQTLERAREVSNQKMQSLLVEELGIDGEVAFQRKEVGPALGKTFWETALWVGITAAILVIIVIFFFFREFVPSIAVILSAVFDISCALALMALFSIPLSLSSIPALLMLVGYSVDTDIMLTTRVLKRKEGTAVDRTKESMKTGLTMTFTTLAALTAMIVISFTSQMFVIFEIAAVLLFGLIGDLPSTWLMNAPILLWYAEKKEKAKESVV